MLQITIPPIEKYNESTNQFITTKSQTIKLEHSLVSISKWEAKWLKPFLSTERNSEETYDYIRCMCLTQNADPDCFYNLTEDNINDICDYISSPMSATTFKKERVKPNREIVTSELIYYWMVQYNIPFECQKWHIQRLLNLIRICGIKNAPPKKVSNREFMAERRALNEARKAEMHTHG